MISKGTDILQHTNSICPECLQKISALLVRRGESVLMKKYCRDHGFFEAVVWRGTPDFESWVRSKIPYSGGERQSGEHGCPYDCGLCSLHGQRTCTALVEITSRCNLCCPVCFADSGGLAGELDREGLGSMFAEIMKQTGGCNLQLSGGEPTVRKDLPEIIKMAKSAGFSFVQLNSNGILLADDPSLASRLYDAGLSSVFLQFDGVEDGIYKVLRGKELFLKKCQAIANIGAAGIGVVLVPTVTRNINTTTLWDIVRFGMEHLPHVRGVHFQPMSYFGRFPKGFRPEHVTLPEVMNLLATQSEGFIKEEDFQPPGCEHALCSFSARYIVQKDGTLQRLGGQKCDCSPQPAEQGALQSIGVTARQWGPVPSPDNMDLSDDLSRFLYHARNNTFSISGMAFQDCWTLNLERLRGCCIHVAQPGGRLIPFCSYNLTARNGRPLHRVPPKKKCRVTTIDNYVGKRLEVSAHLSRAELDRAQMTAFRRTVRQVMNNSTFYRQRFKGLDPQQLHSLVDIEKVSMMEGQDIVEHGHGMLCTSQSRVARVVTLCSSGSTGEPKRFSFSELDLAATRDFFLKGMMNLVGRESRVLVLLPWQQPESVGDLLIQALSEGGIYGRGLWPPPSLCRTAELVESLCMNCIVGLPYHLLGVSEAVKEGQLSSMLLCSDYAAGSLRKRIEDNCGCETFLHYGSTESGLGGAVECSSHNGCHIRESDLLVEIVDPVTGKRLPDGERGEVVITTLGREAMPLIRYRTGDNACLDRSQCVCGGITARLTDIFGRLQGCSLSGGGVLYSQMFDDCLFTVPELLDFRISVDQAETGADKLQVEYVCLPGAGGLDKIIQSEIIKIQAVREGIAQGSMILGKFTEVQAFEASHTVKRSILDLRRAGERNADYSG